MSRFTSNSDDPLANSLRKFSSLSIDEDIIQSKFSQQLSDENDIDTDDDSELVPFFAAQDSVVSSDECDENKRERRRRHFFDREQVNLEPYQLVWCDAKVNDLTVSLSELRKIVDYTKRFDNIEDCLHHIKKLTDTVTFLVCSSDFGELIVPKVHDQTNVRSIYIFSSDKSFDEQLLTNFSKIQQPYDDLKTLLDHLTEDVQQYVKQDKDTIFSEVERQNRTADQSASWWPTFIQLLCHLPYPENSCQTVISTLKKYYQGNTAELNKLEEFERTYTPETAIWWYTRDAFLYRLLNKALRQQNTETLFLFGFYVRDIYNQLKKEHQNLARMLDEEPIYRVYRGQMMSLDEIKHLEGDANPNKFVETTCHIVINSFFSTTIDRSMALLMLDPSKKASDELQNVLFEIELDIRNESRPFGNISHLSNFASENEVLLMAGTELQIVQVVFDDETKAYLMKSKLNEDKIVTMDDNFPDSTEKEVLKNCLEQALEGHFLVDPEDLDIIFDGLKQIFPSETGWFEAFKHQCLAHYELISDEDARSTFFHYKEAIKIYENYLNDRELNFAANIASIHYRVGSIYASQIYDRSSAANHYDLGIRCVTSFLQKATKPKHLIELYEIIGDLYGSQSFNKNESNENSLNAIKYRQLQLQEMLKYYPPNHIELADCFHDLAYNQKSNSLFEEAVKSYEKAVEIYHAQRWPRFDDIKSIYKELSEIFITNKKDYAFALYYKQKQLETLKDHLKTDYQKSWKMIQLADCHMELADIYSGLNQLEFSKTNLLIAKPILERGEDAYKDYKIKQINDKLEYIASLS